MMRATEDRPRSSPRARRRGAVHIWVVVLTLTLIGFVGIALDAGYVVLTLNQMQAGGDAAALAGALQCKLSAAAAQDAAITVAEANTAGGGSITLTPNPDNVASGDVVVGRYNRQTRVFTPNAAGPNACKVVVRRNAASRDGRLSLFFGPVFGVNALDLSRTAIAMTDGTAGAGVVILDPDDRGALTVGGNVNLNVLGGTVQVNSNNSSGGVLTGGAKISADEINIVGNFAFNGNSVFTGALHTGEPFMPDPLAWLPAPTYTTSGSNKRQNITSGTTVTLNPGYFGGELAVNGTANLNPGIYVFNNGVSVAGNGTLTGQGVMLYIASGGINFQSGAHITLTPPDPEVNSFPGANTYEGVAIFQARNNTTTAHYELSQYMSFHGTFYFPKNQVDVHSSGSNYLGRLIANTMTFTGVGSVTVDWRGHDPAAGNVPFLVQ